MSNKNYRRLNIDFTIDDQPQRKSYGQSFTNYGPGYRRPLGTVPNFDAKFGEAKNYNNPRFNIRGQQIHYSKKILTSTRIRVKKYYILLQFFKYCRP